MGLYIRKSFRAGPVRFNLSKSGLGVSGGVKGARLGLGPKGTYVHAGRNGLYYRKQLSTGQSRSQSTADGEGLGILLLGIIAIGLSIWIFSWLMVHPVTLVAGIAIVIVILALRWRLLQQRQKAVTNYKNLLDSSFVTTQSPPSASVLASLRQQQQNLPNTTASKQSVEKIETDIYQAILDKVLDDAFISKDEAATIAAAEQTLRIDFAVRLRTKKEIFSSAYIEAIEDREITQEEFDKLSNLREGLAIPQQAVQQELDIVKQIIDTQTLRLPLKSIPPAQLTVPIQKSEVAFYQCPAQVLSKRKSKDSVTGYEYSVRRDGTMMITNKRAFVVGEGTTNLRFSDIGDVDVDIDAGIIEILKVGSGRPIALKTEAPIYAGRIIDLLVNSEAGGNSA